MKRVIVILGLAALVLLIGLSPSGAQDKKDDLDKFREAFSKPKTPLDFWNALSFELDVGRPDLAAGHLKALLATKPKGPELLKIVEQDGMTEVLKLRNVPVWFTGKDKESEKKDKEAKDNVRELIRLITEANAARLKDVGPRVREMIKQLRATKEEREYALRELTKLGAVAVPEIVNAHINAAEAADRQAVLLALERLGPGALPPMLAALDSDNLQLKLDLLDVFRQKHARSTKEIVPHLWFISASPKQPELARKKATKVLSDFEGLPAAKLPAAKVALVREAERYYKGEATFAPTGNVIWRWDGKKLVEGWPELKPPVPTATANQAAEYFGLRYAGQALALDPTYRPAQVVFLSLAVDKSPGSPGVAELVGKASADLLLEVLDRALKDKKSTVVLTVVQALGDRAEVKAKRPLAKGEPALVQALYYPDARVQLAAAEALLRIPGAAPDKTKARIVEVLKNALSPATTMVPGRKVLIAVADEDWRNKVGVAVRETGATPVSVTNGRDALKRLKANNEYEAVLMSSDLPHPGLAHTLAQVRTDRDVARVPILIAAVPTTRAGHEASRRYEALRKRRDSLTAETADYRAELRRIDIDERAAKKDVETDKSLKSDEKYKALERVEEKFTKERTLAADRNRGAARLLEDLPRVEAGMQREIKRYDLEVELREGQLTRFLTRYPGTRVVHASLMTDGKALDRALADEIKEAGVTLTAQDRQAATEKAITLLAALSAGRPAGYDVSSASGAILDALRNGRLSPDGQLAAIQAAALLSGPRPQQELAAVVRASARSEKIRIEAASALLQNIGRQGRQLTRNEIAAVQGVAKEAKVGPRLKDLVDKLTGALQNDDKRTGERLRDYRYVPRK